MLMCSGQFKKNESSCMKNLNLFEKLCEKYCLLEKKTFVSIDKIVENKKSSRILIIFCFTLSHFFAQ